MSEQTMTRGAHARNESVQESHTVEMPVPSGLTLSPVGPMNKVGSFFRASAGIWLGLAVAAAGFVTIFVSWIRTAGLINVALQVPYLVSGGLTGLALVIVGMTVIDISVRRQEGHERRQQLAQMSRVLRELHEYLQPEDDGEYLEYEA